ncbi:MAG: CHRD domain-containing protein [Actinobacteria bacterium]|nr:CHRD domain-containing protein [Actinomycetota bacterium]
MSKRAFVLLAAALSASLIAAFVVATQAAPAVRTAQLNGEKEDPDGDLNGKGSARVRINTQKKKVCVSAGWRRIASPTGMHIHDAPRGENGAIVVGFFQQPGNPLPDSLRGARACVRGRSDDPSTGIGIIPPDGMTVRELLRDIREHSRQYYVNIHNDPFPAGAIRGQLHR